MNLIAKLLVATLVFLFIPRMGMCAGPVEKELAASLRILEPDFVTSDSASLLRIHASPLGIGGLTSPVVCLTLPEPVIHDIANIFEVQVQAEEQSIVVPMAQLANGATEVLGSRILEPSTGPVPMRWALEQRLAAADDVTSFTLSVADARPGTPADPASVMLHSARVVNASELSDREVLDASPWQAINLSFHAPSSTNSPLEVVLALPSVVALRNQGAKLLFLRNQELIHEMSLEIQNVADSSIYIRNIALPTRNQPTGPESARVYLKRSNGESLLIGEQSFTVQEEDRLFGQFEAPGQSILDYGLYEGQPELVVSTILGDLYAKSEPRDLAPSAHELTVYTLSPSSTRFDMQPALRVPAFSHWAEAGFRGIDHAGTENIRAIYLGAGTTLRHDRIGMAAAVGRSSYTGAVTNPVYEWNPEFSADGSPSGEHTSSLAIEHYGRGYVMMAWTQADGCEPRMVASVSHDLRSWADAGVVPVPLEPVSQHVDLYERAGVFYMMTDDPGFVLVSLDPLREWKKVPVQFPSDWFALRLFDYRGSSFVFGLSNQHGRNILRWRQVDWNDELEIPIPTLSNKPSLMPGI